MTTATTDPNVLSKILDAVQQLSQQQAALVNKIDTLENKHTQELDHIQQRLNEIGISKGSRLFPARDRSHSDGNHLEDGSCCSARLSDTSTSVVTPNKSATKRNLNAPLYNHRIVLTTYPGQLGVNPIPLSWGAKTPMERGPILVSRNPQSLKMRNAIGAHGGSYCVYRALAVAIGELSPTHKPDFFNTQPPISIGPFPQWSDPEKIVSLDPWGHICVSAFAEHLKNGLDVRPSIAVTKAHMRVPEIENSLRDKKLVADGHVCLANGDLVVTKGAIEPVWYLPGVAKRFGVDEVQLRRALFEDCGGMYPELITRPDLKVFLPPIGGISVYIFGNPAYLSDPTKELALRIHDECNGSDVFGSDICTCRPYLIFGIEECVKTAQRGGVGLIVYFRKEGRALGEVTKYLVYNARKRAAGGDTASDYFKRTEFIAGVKDMRFQALMPDTLHWLGITKIDRMLSMSHHKHDAIVESGIIIKERIPIPEDLIPEDSRVEIDAKIASGYFSAAKKVTEADLVHTKGRNWDDIHH